MLVQTNIGENGVVFLFQPPLRLFQKQYKRKEGATQTKIYVEFTCLEGEKLILL